MAQLIDQHFLGLQFLGIKAYNSTEEAKAAGVPLNSTGVSSPCSVTGIVLDSRSQDDKNRGRAYGLAFKELGEKADDRKLLYQTYRKYYDEM